jgi:hypothetical protein
MSRFSPSNSTAIPSPIPAAVLSVPGQKLELENAPWAAAKNT